MYIVKLLYEYNIQARVLLQVMLYTCDRRLCLYVKAGGEIRERNRKSCGWGVVLYIIK